MAGIQRTVDRIFAAVIMVAAIAGTSHFAGEWNLWSQLEDANAAFAVAKVDARQDKFPYAARPGRVIHYIEISYSFAVDGADVHSTLLCSNSCGELAKAQRGDEIRIRYSRQDPHFNRAVSLGLDSTIAFKAMTFACLVIAVVAMWAVWKG
jgi:hypothetical protein